MLFLLLFHLIFYIFLFDSFQRVHLLLFTNYNLFFYGFLLFYTFFAINFRFDDYCLSLLNLYHFNRLLFNQNLVFNNFNLLLLRRFHLLLVFNLFNLLLDFFLFSFYLHVFCLILVLPFNFLFNFLELHDQLVFLLLLDLLGFKSLLFHLFLLLLSYFSLLFNFEGLHFLDLHTFDFILLNFLLNSFPLSLKR